MSSEEKNKLKKHRWKIKIKVRKWTAVLLVKIGAGEKAGTKQFCWPLRAWGQGGGGVVWTSWCHLEPSQKNSPGLTSPPQARTESQQAPAALVEEQIPTSAT
jgi:hypothetical protein